MIRSLLFALDGSHSSITAGDVSLTLARQFGANVEVLGIVNSEWIQRPMPTPIGGFAIKMSMDKHLLAAAEDRVGLALEEFKETARQAEVASVLARVAEGSPVSVITDAATPHDVVLVGRDSLFDVDGELYELPLCVERIVRGEPRPVILIPTSYKPDTIADASRPILMAFDGSPASSRTLHMLALLGLARDRTVHVVTLDESSAENASRIAKQACQLLNRHGVTSTHPIGLGEEEAGTPSETILGLSRSLDVGLIGMGAYGHHGIREIFGSCTREVLNACPTAIFLHH